MALKHIRVLLETKDFAKNNYLLLEKLCVTKYSFQLSHFKEFQKQLKIFVTVVIIVDLYCCMRFYNYSNANVTYIFQIY